MDSAGTVTWACSTESVDGTANVNGVALDGDGNVYVTGAFGGSVDFAPGSTVAMLVEANPGSDAYLWNLTPVETTSPQTHGRTGHGRWCRGRSGWKRQRVLNRAIQR